MAQSNRNPGKTPKDALKRFTDSGKGLLTGVYDGVAGVITKPIEGAMDEGFEGFFKGLGKGVVGAVVHPIAGAANFVSGSVDSIKIMADSLNENRPSHQTNENVNEANLHRSNTFEGQRQDGPVAAGGTSSSPPPSGTRVPTSTSDPRPDNGPHGDRQAFNVLQMLENGKYVSTDTFMGTVPIGTNSRAHLLITNRRVMYVMKEESREQWSTRWVFCWDELKGVPESVEDGIKIFLKDSRSSYGLEIASIFVPISDPSLKQVVLLKMDDIMTSQ